jgi:hypothetical protein
VTAVTFGTGRAGQFTISNSGSAASAIEATTNGTGLAGKFNGPVDVAGKLTTTYGGGGQHRAAPIAYGSFGLLGAGTSTISGSGNVTVAYLGSDTYRVTVSGQSNPSSWIVEARVAYSNPASPDVEYENLRVGIPNASGQILIYCPCTSGCGVFTSQSADVHYVVYQP